MRVFCFSTQSIDKFFRLPDDLEFDDEATNEPKTNGTNNAGNNINLASMITKKNIPFQLLLIM